MVKEDKLQLIAMFSTIQSMNNGALKLYSISRTETSKKEDSQFILPSAVLSAFTCELCLKAILIIEGVEIKNIHNLKDLFKLLKPVYKKEIINNTINYTLKNSKKDSINFEKELHSIANAFVNLRYFYEKIEDTKFRLANYAFLNGFRIALLQQFVDIENKYAEEMNSILNAPD